MTSTPAERLQAIVGSAHVVTDPDVLDGRSVDYTGRYRGRAIALVRPGSADEVAAVLRECRAAEVCVTVQGGRTSLVAGTVPEHEDVLLSTERLTEIGEVDATERRVRAGSGVALAALQRAAAAAGLLFGVDLAARDSATVGGMASTNAGGLRTVRYGNMGEQVIGLDVALPDGSVVHRHSQVRADNTGYDLASLFIGAEGTLGVITSLDLRLHPIPNHRVTAVCGFSTLDALVAAGRELRDTDAIAALEMIDRRAAALAAEHLGVPVPVEGDWLLLIELAGDTDLTERLADALEEADLADEPAVGIDWSPAAAVAGARVHRRGGRAVRSAAEIRCLASAFGYPSVCERLRRAGRRACPEAIPVLFGHIGEGNLHLNVLRCGTEQERHLYAAMMKLIAAHGGNVSSEHGIGSRKRAYLGMSREPADIAAMRAIKSAFDPTGYLNPAVLFD